MTATIHTLPGRGAPRDQVPPFGAPCARTRDTAAVAGRLLRLAYQDAEPGAIDAAEVGLRGLHSGAQALDETERTSLCLASAALLVWREALSPGADDHTVEAACELMAEAIATLLALSGGF
jgi:hypothetical protein